MFRVAVLCFAIVIFLQFVDVLTRPAMKNNAQYVATRINGPLFENPPNVRYAASRNPRMNMPPPRPGTPPRDFNLHFGMDVRVPPGKRDVSHRNTADPVKRDVSLHTGMDNAAPGKRQVSHTAPPAKRDVSLHTGMDTAAP